MIEEKELYEAIAECQGVRNPNANTCIKLASYYTILDHVRQVPDPLPQYSFDPGPPNTFGDVGDSEFLRLLRGKNIDSTMRVVDEIMGAVYVLSPRLYNGAMRKLKEVE